MVQESNNKQPVTNTWLIAILAVGVFSILNMEMGIIGVLPMVAEQYDVNIVKAGYLVSFFNEKNIPVKVLEIFVRLAKKVDSASSRY